LALAWASEKDRRQEWLNLISANEAIAASGEGPERIRQIAKQLSIARPGECH
jgi:hypothetical protein